jgi:septal ring-binding cell division protein DamX
MAKAKKEKKEKEKKKRKAGPKKQSLARNVTLLVLSVVFLGGASFLFTWLSSKPEYSYEPIQKNLGKITAKAREKAPAPQAETAPEKSSSGAYDDVWNMLMPRGQDAQTATRYGVQIAAFGSRDEAARRADEVQEKIRLRCDVEARGGMYVVAYGNFRTRQGAESSCRTLSSRLHQDCVVVEH